VPEAKGIRARNYSLQVEHWTRRFLGELSANGKLSASPVVKSVRMACGECSFLRQQDQKSYE
jgi:hypothetical protein